MDDKCDCGDEPYTAPVKIEITSGPPPECEWCEQADALGDACCRELERLQSKRGKR